MIFAPVPTCPGNMDARTQGRARLPHYPSPPEGLGDRCSPSMAAFSKDAPARTGGKHTLGYFQGLPTDDGLRVCFSSEVRSSEEV